MSFGDLNPSHLPVSQTATAETELRGALKALGANNASLRRTSALLRSDDASARPNLKQVRALRDQNREMARAASLVAARVDMQAARTGRESEAASARQVRAQFEALVDDFSDALRESVEAEKMLLASSPAVSPSHREQPVAPPQLAGEETRVLVDESSPLLAEAVHTQSERAQQREVQANDEMFEERHAVLTEIQSSVDDVNSIFKDLAAMIGDQRSQIEYIEVDVADAAENIGAARRELHKTQIRRQNRKSFFFCTLLFIACVIAVLLIILLN